MLSSLGSPTDAERFPEQQEVERLEAERISRKDASVAVEIQIDDIDRDIRKLEGEVDAVRQREDRDRTLLQSGSVGAKQLTELEHELGSLVRRQGLLEDELLEVMEQREALQADHDHAGAQLSQAEEELIDAKRRRDDAVADLDKAQERCAADRERLVGEFPADFLAVYEKQRTLGGPGRGRFCRHADAALAGSRSTAARSRESPRRRPTS